MVDRNLDGTGQPLRRLANELEPDVAFDVSELEKTVGSWLLPSRAAAGLSGIIGVLALLMVKLRRHPWRDEPRARPTEAGIRHPRGDSARDNYRT